MNQPEHELAGRIIRHLDHGVDQLAPATRQRLLVARRAALARRQEQHERVTGLAWAGQAVTRFADRHPAGARYAIGVSALVIALAGIAYWQSNGVTSELAEIDSGLLTDELPINAYLDKGFDAWLKRSSR